MIIILAIAMVLMGLIGCIYYEVNIINSPKIVLNVKVTDYDDEAVYVMGEISNPGNKTAYISQISNKLNRKIFIHRELAFVDKLNLLEEGEITLTPNSTKELLLGSIQTISTLNPEDYSDNKKYSEDRIIFDITYSGKSKAPKNSKKTKNSNKDTINDKKSSGAKKFEGEEKPRSGKHKTNEKVNAKDNHTTYDLQLHHNLFNEAEKLILNRTITNERYYRASRHSNDFLNTLTFPDGEATRKLYKPINKEKTNNRDNSKNL